MEMRLAALTAALLIFPSQAPADTLPECRSSLKGPNSNGVEQANTALVRRFHDAINHQDWKTADSLVSSDYRHHVTAANGFRVITWEGFKRGNQRLRSAFPDWKNGIVQT